MECNITECNIMVEENILVEESIMEGIIDLMKTYIIIEQLNLLCFGGENPQSR
jgi:hypothetical protein